MLLKYSYFHEQQWPSLYERSVKYCNKRCKEERDKQIQSNRPTQSIFLLNNKRFMRVVAKIKMKSVK